MPGISGSRRRACLRVLVLCLLSWLAPRVALAQSCVFTASNIAFGNVSTLNGGPTDAVGTINANCTGYSTPYVRLCMSLGKPVGDAWTQKYLPGPSGQQIAYNIFSDPTHQTLWGSYYSSGNPPLVSVDLPVTGGNASTSLTMYGRVSGGQTNLPAGSYSRVFATSDTMFVYVGYTGTPPNCMATNSPVFTAGFTVTASVIADCNIVAQPLNFPAAGVLNQPVRANTTLQVTCVSGAPYTVALDAGTTPGGTVALRKLTTADGKTVNYQLYRDAAWTQLWGDGTLGTSTGAGTGNGTPQTLTVYGQVPAQTSQPAGTYTDTVTATVGF